MKKSVLLIGGMLTLALALNTFAQTNVYSRNAVGYVNVALSKGFTMMSVPLNQGTTTPLTINDVFGTSLPDSSVIYLFTPPSGPYVAYYYIEGDGWYDSGFSSSSEGTNVLPRGTGFWVSIPTSYTGTVVNISLVGEVPSTTGASTTGIQLANGFVLLGFPYPTSINITNTVLNANAQDGDVLYVWNGTSYTPYYFIEGDGWLDASFNPTTVTLDTALGYWYLSSQARSFNETKPYNWP